MTVDLVFFWKNYKNNVILQAVNLDPYNILWYINMYFQDKNLPN